MLKSALVGLYLFSIGAYAQNVKVYVTLSPAGDFVAESDELKGKVYETATGGVEAADLRISARSFKSGIGLRDEHMINKYLEAAKHPDIILKIGKGIANKGEAILILKGKQGKVNGSYVKANNKLKAAFKMKLSEFGINEINYKGIGVDDEVKVEVLTAVVKKDAAVPKKSTKKTAQVKAPLKTPTPAKTAAPSATTPTKAAPVKAPPQKK